MTVDLTWRDKALFFIRNLFMTFIGYEAADPRIVRLRSTLTEDQILDFDYKYKDKYRSEDLAKVFCYWFGFIGRHKIYLGKSKEFLLYAVCLIAFFPINIFLWIRDSRKLVEKFREFNYKWAERIVDQIKK